VILKYLFELWLTIAPAAGNHLWQSTLFGVLAGLLTLLLRKNHARARYWLWLAASVKFLIPLSVLIGLGSHLGWTRHSTGTESGWYFAVEEFSQPFTRQTVPAISRVSLSAIPTTPTHWLPAVVAAVWIFGFVVVVFVWYWRWRRISAVLRHAARPHEGREVQALRRLERRAGIRKPIEMFLSGASLEPGIFGIARPVLVWPAGISKHLRDEQLDTILAHEVCHVRRHDNLAAAIHMFVEALFWFHPLIWWLGAQLWEERERACDEEVLESGGERQVYAEGILKVCEFCLGSPLSCISGVTGADLKRRIVRIITGQVARELDFGRKLLLSATGLLAVAAPIVFGAICRTPPRAQSQAQSTSQNALVYEVASIKPNKSGQNMVSLRMAPDGLSGTNVTLHMLMKNAYGVEDNQIEGAPSWFTSERYDIEAKMDSAAADELRKLNEEERKLQRQRMLQALLADRLKLSIHRETKELPTYALVVAKNGPKLHEAKPGDADPNGSKGPDGRGRQGIWMQMGGGGMMDLTVQGQPLASLARLLTGQLHRTVVDNTGLKGNYDFKLQWTRDESQGAMFKGPELGPSGGASPPPPDSSGPSIFTAIQEQLGLKLESQKGPVEILVVDHVERPSEN